MNLKKVLLPFSIALGLSLVLIAPFLGLYVLVWKAPQQMIGNTKAQLLKATSLGIELLERAGADLYRALQFEPLVVIQGETVHQKPLKIREIATAEKAFTQTYTYEVIWAGSKKTLKIQGDFLAKVGFKIDQQAFYMEIAKDASQITLHHKKPQLLSCEMIRMEVLRDEDGWWNKIQAQDREAAQNELLRQAREAAIDVNFEIMALENLMDRLKPLSHKHAFDLKTKAMP